jgi:hypothetical protein
MAASMLALLAAESAAGKPGLLGGKSPDCALREERKKKLDYDGVFRETAPPRRHLAAWRFAFEGDRWIVGLERM